MTTGQPLVQAERVSKRFCRDFRKSLVYGMRDLGAALLPIGGDRSRLRADEFWAVDDVGFSLARGECLGLLGRNGAGKTTLLRMLTGLIRPDKGRITVSGDVGALIAIGAGGREILTGRENIYCMGALRGLSRREIDRRMDEIIDFAELRDSIDAPLQTYSSGMRVRLNFAVATAIRPDVLFLDEVLAVGDAAFREKCYHRVSEMRRNAAVVFVSHNMEQVSRICDRGLVLDHGRVAFAGDIDTAISHYERVNDQGTADPDAPFVSVRPPVVRMAAHATTTELPSGSPLEVMLEAEASESAEGLAAKVILYNAKGGFAGDGITPAGIASLRLSQGTNRVRLTVDSLPVRNGSYWLSVHLIDARGDIVGWLHKGIRLTVHGAYAGTVSDLALRVQGTRA